MQECDSSKLLQEVNGDEWEGPLFCGNRCFKHQKKAPNAAASKAKGSVAWHNDCMNPKINPMVVMITSNGHNRWRGGDKQNSSTK